MHMTGELIGTISVYRLTGDSLAEPIDAAQTLAESAASIILTASATLSEIPDAGHAASRPVVHQAAPLSSAGIW